MNRLFILGVFISLSVIFDACNDGVTGASGGGGTGNKRIKLVAVSNGNLGGVSGADSLCGTNYKAMISDGDSVGANGRVACTTNDCSGGVSEHNNWVLAANRTYYNTNWNVIGTTDANGIFVYTTTQSNSVESLFTTYDVWTGMNNRWVSTANNCTTWTSTGTSGDKGIVGGSTLQTFGNWLNNGSGAMSCATTTYYILCVEQ